MHAGRSVRKMERKNAGRERDGEAQFAASRLPNREGQQASSRSSVSSPEGISNVRVPQGSNNITVPSDHDAVQLHTSISFSSP